MPIDRNNSNFDFTEPLLAVAAEYTKYTKRGDSMKWSPTQCYSSTLPKVSKSKDEGTHGRKLYYLL